MILERIKAYMDVKGIKIAPFEKSIGMSNASFGKSLKNNGSIGTDKLENILSIYSDINPVWLLTGEGSMLKTNGSMNDTPSQSVTVVDSKGTKNNSNNQGNKQQSVDATAFLSFIKEKDAAHEAVIKEKDTIIEQKNQEIKQLQREIGRLEGELKRVSASDTNISTDAQMANAV